MQLYHARRLSLAEVIARFTAAPARILRLKKGTLGPGADADVTVIDPDAAWICHQQDSASKSRNSPFDGWPLKGRAVLTIVGGKIVWREETQFASVQPDN